ncbi:RNA-guided endonuclease InsQ/TnpB family protein [Alicyclobacillus herbarius]|uniref:RNA-guided endonuclease InsQ/TnpB family protein n=1 Tax=Alicyclobacillus herbarius TaxID=122960 RepID=UPI000417A6A0|nr:RNA-guided endonuclease TnpB family protein [Alicyclobacillus herbarius]
MIGYRFRLYPTKEQEKILLRWIGCQRVIYNAKVAEERYFRTFRNHLVELTGMPIPVDQTYAQFVTETTAFLRDVPSVVLRNGAALWRQAYLRYQRGLAERPKFKRKSGEQSVWLTSEVFSFQPVVDWQTGDVLRYQLIVGTKKFPVGELVYCAHRPHGIPASIHIKVSHGRWYVSFSCDDGTCSPDEADIAASMRTLEQDALLERTLGLDRGVAKPLATSDGRVFDLLPVQKARIQKCRKQKVRWQRRAARRQDGSRNQQTAYARASRYDAYETNVRWDYAHQTSHRLVADDRYELYVFEDLLIQNMTKRPKPKQDAKGRFVPNRASQKAALNRAILASAWGQVLTFTRYKAQRTGKLVVVIPPAYSSQACAVCGYTHPDNRQTQAEFVCLRCGHRANADHNAAINIARRGVAKIVSGEFERELEEAKAKVKRVRLRKLGSERSEVTPVESPLVGPVGTQASHGSEKQEVPLETAETSA